MKKICIIALAVCAGLGWAAGGAAAQESVTVKELDISRVYHVYAHDYTNGRSASSLALSKSGAVVRIYNESQLVRAFAAPSGAPGNLWRVCRIVNGVVEE